MSRYDLKGMSELSLRAQIAVAKRRQRLARETAQEQAELISAAKAELARIKTKAENDNG